jgi:hypothetical protein
MMTFALKYDDQSALKSLTQATLRQTRKQANRVRSGDMYRVIFESRAV